VLEFGRAVPATGHLNDARLQAFLLGWDWQALCSAPLGIFDPPIFHPEPGALTYMDHLVGETLLSSPFLAASGSVAPAYNFLVLFSFVASAWAVYRLTRLLGVSRTAAFLAGFLFAFSPYRFGSLDMLNVLQTQFLPFGLFFGIRFSTRHRARDLWALAGVFVAQVYFGWYYTFYLILVLCLLLAHALARGGLAIRRLFALDVLLAAGAALILALPVVVPYVEQGLATPSYRRSLAEAETYSATPFEYLRVNRRALNSRWHPSAAADHSYWPGVVTVGLAAAGIAGLWRRRGAAVAGGGYFLLLSVVAFVLSLGPYLRAAGRRVLEIPLPYAALHSFLPGWASMRAPGRLASVVLLALVVLAALGYDRLRARTAGTRPMAWRTAAGALFLVAIVSAWQHPPIFLELPTAATLPPVYAWLARQPEATPLVEIPVAADERNESETDILRQYYVLYHGKPRLDGASGFVSPQYRAFRAALRAFPADAALDEAARLGAERVIVHLGDFTLREREELEARMRAARRLVPEQRFGDVAVFRLGSGSGSAAGEAEGPGSP
jgi:hypothetical protein